ncbi:ISL3 family transposase [Neobacillus notoginsengisoli]|uniref:ISL3 family transposase n=1 Tax=Neobacillus notoginsengisoli TaxID=1578198 RepID=A0A417YRE0_9BACI|nr:ISL3 family transposase [Neobacillus notoginsengisoli]RHW37306.1 ISL3 family transposase [Neobacillus notoginsengisoli]
MLNLSEFKVIKQEQNNHFYRFTVEKKEMPYMCMQCGSIQFIHEGEDIADNVEFKLHQVKERTVSDISMHGKAVRLVLKHRRFKCSACDGTFYEYLESIERNGKVTKRLVEHIKQLTLKRPFLTIGEEYGISHTSVRRYFLEFVEEKERDRRLIAPRVLGIDEAHLNRTMRGVFTDNENRIMLEMTPDNLKRTVKATIQSMEGYKNIEVATVDMNAGYKYAMNELVPDCYVVVDKFHVIKYAQEALNAIRVQIKNGLPKDERRFLTRDRWVLLRNKEDLEWRDIERRMEWFKRYPLLEKAYWLKEGIRDVYNQSEDKHEALERFAKWESEIPKEFKEFKAIRRTFNNNKQEIFNYFDRPYTNAYTESVNNIIKSVEKAGKGYTFDVLRAKVLYGTHATLKKPKYTEEMEFQPFEKLWGGKFDMEPIRVSPDPEPEFDIVGVDLTTLNEILKRGDF